MRESRSAGHHYIAVMQGSTSRHSVVEDVTMIQLLILEEALVGRGEHWFHNLHDPLGAALLRNATLERMDLEGMDKPQFFRHLIKPIKKLVGFNSGSFLGLFQLPT